MSNEAPTVLILGGTGRTGSRVAGNLARQGISTRTAARSGADVRFDWDDPATHADALAGVDSFRAFAERNARAWTGEAK